MKKSIDRIKRRKWRREVVEMRAQIRSMLDDWRRRDIESIPQWVNIVVEPWPSTNFLLVNNNTLNLCIAHPLVICFFVNKIPNQLGFLPIWVPRENMVSIVPWMFDISLCLWTQLCVQVSGSSSLHDGRTCVVP
jgi:hypothetical protein